MTAGNGFGGGGSTGDGVSGARWRALSGFELAFAFGALLDLVTGASGAGAGSGAASGDLNATCSSAPAAGCSLDGSGSGSGSGCGSGSGGLAGFGWMTGAGASTTCRLGTSARRTCQGKARPGSPNSSPNSVRLSSRAWNSVDSSRAKASRRRWLRVRRIACWPEATAAIADPGTGPGGKGGVARVSVVLKRTPP